MILLRVPEAPPPLSMYEMPFVSVIPTDDISLNASSCLKKLAGLSDGSVYATNPARETYQQLANVWITGNCDDYD